jgi:hypothetical protein
MLDRQPLMFTANINELVSLYALAVPPDSLYACTGLRCALTKRAQKSTKILLESALPFDQDTIDAWFEWTCRNWTGDGRAAVLEQFMSCHIPPSQAVVLRVLTNPQ